MNTQQKQAIASAIGNAEDNLYRAELQKESDPNWVSGNGEPIDLVIQQYKNKLSQLKEGIK